MDERINVCTLNRDELVAEVKEWQYFPKNIEKISDNVLRKWLVMNFHRFYKYDKKSVRNADKTFDKRRYGIGMSRICFGTSCGQIDVCHLMRNELISYTEVALKKKYRPSQLQKWFGKPLDESIRNYIANTAVTSLRKFLVKTYPEQFYYSDTQCSQNYKYTFCQ